MQSNSHMLDWLYRRGITQEVLDLFNVTIHHHPQIGDCIKIPITDTFAKYRRDPLDDRKPKYLYDSGGKVTLYGADKVDLSKPVLITEGECFPQDAQILTPTGWVTYEEYEEMGGEVAQYNVDGTIEFVAPIALVKKAVKNTKLVEYSDQNKYVSITTMGHNLIELHPTKGIKKFTAANGPSTKVSKIIRTAKHNGPGLLLSDDEIRFQVMVSADFTIRNGGDLYACFKKERKVERFKSLCESLDIPYSCSQTPNGYYSCYIKRVNKPDYVSKIFDHWWISQSTQNQKEIILEELVFWDGNTVPNRNQVEYSSKEHTNATFIQTIAHLCGYVSTIIHRYNQYGEWYKVSILFGKQYSSWQGKKPRPIDYTGHVYCVQVPSGMILVRQFDCISVSGNCDALVGWSHNIQSVSSTGGALSFQEEWGHTLMNTHVYLCFDNDDAGAEGMVKVLKYIPTAKVVLIPETTGVKDISDYVSRGGDLHKLLQSAKSYPDVAAVEEDMATRRATWQSTRFHEKFLDAHRQKEQRATQDPNPYTGTDPVLKAKSYPLENLIEFDRRKALCPWHNESSPSLHFYPKTNSAYCFGCGKTVDSIEAYMHVHGVGFLEAVKELSGAVDPLERSDNKKV